MSRDESQLGLQEREDLRTAKRILLQHKLTLDEAAFPATQNRGCNAVADVTSAIDWFLKQQEKP